MNVLTVDDSMAQRGIVKNTMKRLTGFENAVFFDAQDGNKAWDFLEKERIDLVLLDYNMPNLSGPELIDRMKSTERHRDTPIIMITAESAKYNVIDVLQKGVNGYCIKPLKEEKLRLVVMEIFSLGVQ